MKKIAILLVACIGLAINTDAQGKKKNKHHHHHHTTKVVKVPTTKPAGPIVSTSTAVSGSISDATTGVMGKDPIKNNSKGQNRNLNTNTGVAVPPSDGGGSR